MDEEAKKYIDEAVQKFREEGNAHIAKLNKASDERFERYIGVAFEQMDHKMEAISENLAPLIELPAQVLELQEKVDSMSDTLDAVFEAVGEHEQILKTR